MTPLQMVRQFHEAFGVPAYDTPRIPPTKREGLRLHLISEEHEEWQQAWFDKDLVGIADALADLVVVIYGTALEYGINLDAVLEEVHASNMAKLGSDGKPIYREDGKILKPEGWKPPNIAAVLRVGDSYTLSCQSPKTTRSQHLRPPRIRTTHNLERPELPRASRRSNGGEGMTEPEVKSVTIDICTYCLEGWGAECHTPGCIFWMCAVPPFETAQRLAYAEESKCYIPDHD